MPEWWPFSQAFTAGFAAGAVAVIDVLMVIDIVRTLRSLFRRYRRPNMGEGRMPPPGYPGGTPN